MGRSRPNTHTSRAARLGWSIHLEPRECPSVFYDFDVVAQTGQNGLTAISPAASVNDSGQVAFVGTTTAQSVYAVTGNEAPQIISFATPTSTRTYGSELQINNDGFIIAVDNVSGASPNPQRRVREWSTAEPGLSATVGRSSTPPIDSTYFNSLGNFASISNDARVAMAGLSGSFWELHRTVAFTTPGSVSTLVATLSSSTFFRQSSADGGRTLLGWRQGTTERVTVWDGLGTSIPFQVTTGANWADIGVRPGISDDGKAVAFYGELTASGAASLGLTPGKGVFVAFDAGLGSWKIVRVAGDPGAAATATTRQRSGELGMDAAGDNLYLSTFDPDTRVSVTRQSLGESGFIGDTFEVAYIATPNAASVPNPLVTGTPLLFSAAKGVWTTQVTVTKQLNGPYAIVYQARSPIPVAQVGDSLGGHVLTDVAVHDALANAATNPDGTTRTERRGDHRVTFWASFTGGSMIVRGLHLDSDEDGLLDHWETNGIDIDQDGAIDLNLAAWGANPLHRDLFLEIDQLVDRTTGGYAPWRNELAPGVAQSLVDMFDAAPALANGIPAGIKLHLDYGPGRSINFGSGILEGGDLIGQPGEPNTHIDVVYFGKPGSLTVPGVETRDFSSIKNAYFGTHNNEKRSRELAFHYTVFADFHSFITSAAGNPFTAAVTSATATTLTAGVTLPTLPPATPGGPRKNLNGHAIKITDGTGEGQVRRISSSVGNQLTVKHAWTVAPDATSTFVLINGSGGRAEVGFRNMPDANSSPGNDLVLALGGFGVHSSGRLGGDDTAPGESSDVDRQLQWRIIAHELGHTLGLRHGGTDFNQYKGAAYKSLMSYSYQNERNSLVNSYAGAEDPTFNDWANLQLDYFRSFQYLGNTFGIADGVSDYDDDVEEYTVADYERLNSPPTVESFAVNGLGGQRSRVTSLVVTFSKEVAVSAANFAVAGFGGTLNMTTLTVNGRTVATITFSGTGVEFGSLADGLYTLNVSGVPELIGTTSYNFHRLFGDVNGDGFVDGTDESAFGSAFGLSSADDGWELFAAFDFNGDGFIDGTDESAFGSRFGLGL